jgi:rubredoxin-NAD+ reductase
MSDIVIIGAGIAAYSTAREIRKLDKDQQLLILSQDNADYYSKPMLSNAVDKNKTANELIISDAQKMADDLLADIRAQTHVNSISPIEHKIHTNTGDFNYKKLILACGANPIKIPFEGDATDEIMSVNHLSDYRLFREQLASGQRLLIIGAGLIGCEFANDLINMDITIDVVDLSPQVLGRLLPLKAATELQNRLADKGINWHLNDSISTVNYAGDALEVCLKNGALLQVDVILSAVGLKPATELAIDSGLVCKRGIVVDRYLETSEQDIYALGDCAQVVDLNLPYVMPIMHAARALAATLTGAKTAVHYPPMPVVVKTPAYPVVVCPPPRPVEGEWQEEYGTDGIVARYIDKQSVTQGFALTGEHVKQRMAMAKEIPDWLSN